MQMPDPSDLSFDDRVVAKLWEKLDRDYLRTARVRRCSVEQVRAAVANYTRHRDRLQNRTAN